MRIKLNDCFPIFSGGLDVTVTGRYLNTVAHPRLIAKVAGGEGQDFEGVSRLHDVFLLLSFISPFRGLRINKVLARKSFLINIGKLM